MPNPPIPHKYITSDKCTIDSLTSQRSEANPIVELYQQEVRAPSAAVRCVVSTSLC